MSDMSYLDPPIEIAATSPRLEMILARMRSTGMRPYPASEPPDFNSTGPLLVDIASVTRTTLEHCARACAAGLSRPMVILDVADAGLDLTDVITLRRDRDLAMLKGRLSALARRQARNMEVSIRAATAREFGITPPITARDAAPELIYVGEGSPIFLSLQGALKSRGLSLTAAISSSTARDYLSSRRFAAALFDLTSDDALETAYIEGPPSGDLLSNVPIFALVNGDSQTSEAMKSIQAHADEIIECQNQAPLVASRIEILARRYSAMRPITLSTDLPPAARDLATGLFSRRFLESHLERQIAVADQRAEPLSLVLLKLTGERRTDRKVLKAMAECLHPLLRDTDCAAALSAGILGISLPTTPYRGGATLATRIATHVSEAEVLADVVLSWRVVEKRAHHSAKTFLDSGLQGPFMRLEAA
jgi:two-component system cell cycle response regulator PopA